MRKFSDITAIIPAAGLGKRLRPHTFTLPKVLISVAGKPILGYILDFLNDIGIEKIVVIIGHLGEKVKEFVEKNYRFKTLFIEQKEFLGLGYAINLTRDYVKGKTLIILGDTLIEGDIVSHLEKGYNWIGIKEVEDPERFGIVIEGKDGWIEKLIEKPEKPVSNKAIVGIYYLNNSTLLFDSLKEIIEKGIRTKGEFQLTDALQILIEKGEKIKAVPIDKWYDCGKVETLLKTNRYLLDKKKSEIKKIPSVVINQPVYIGERTKISNCVIGPYVSIGNGVEIENVIIQDSIINDNSVIKNVILKNSVIGQNAVLIDKPQMINLGDNSEIKLEETD